MQSAGLSCSGCSEDSLGVIELSCGQLGEGEGRYAGYYDGRFHGCGAFLEQI